MKERGILFSAPMVRALRAGPKTQTRRALRVQPPAETASFCTYHHPDPRVHHWAFDGGSLLDFAVPCPYGQPGDRLWVRETWACLDSHKRPGARLAYRADTPDGERVRVDAPWIPAIHMNRWASRILLEVTRVRVERLQDISEADAIAEGIPTSDVSPPDMARFAYRQLWESINGAGTWEDNPWVWAVDFKRVMQRPHCAVGGLIRPGAMCGSVIVGSKECGHSGTCPHQRVMP